MKYIKFALIVISILSCSVNDSDRKKNNSTNNNIENTKKKNKVKTISTKNVDNNEILIEYFNEIPDTIDGCSELFYIDTNEYIMVTNIIDFGIIKLDGSLHFLQIDTSYSIENRDTEINYTEYSNEYYKIEAKLILEDTIDELYIYEGELLIIRSLDNKKVKLNIRCEIGC